MKTEIEKMHQTWDSLLKINRNRTELPAINFDEILSSIFALGSFYHYIIDFYDMSVSNISNGFAEAHGVAPEQIKTINDVLQLIHPDDMDFVAQAEKKACDFMYKQLEASKIPRYKVCYNFRFKTPMGYQLFNHQSLVLTMDDNNNFIKSLNIHTNISHLTQRNNYTFSIIGLAGEPSYLNMVVVEKENTQPASASLFSKRELEIIRLLAKGHKSEHIAEQLSISTDTVKTHRKNILGKSGCRNTSELIATGMSEGWI
ncbi:MAG: helix-turn-helix transcriptional regulator [Bacteroidota bacterium]|nr:helix-turn-helix transcriptional regulator [Bacteroidota bacterium]